MSRPLNLLPLSFRYQVVRRARLRQWFFVCACGLVIVGADCGLYVSLLSHNRAKLFDLEQQSTAVKTLRTRNAELEVRLAELNQRHLPLELAGKDRIAFEILGVVSQATGDCGQGIQVQHLSLTRHEKPQVDPAKVDKVPKIEKPADEKQVPEERTVLNLKGMGADNLAVALFVSALRKCEAFKTVDLKSSVSTQGNPGAARQYIIECTF